MKRSLLRLLAVMTLLLTSLAPLAARQPSEPSAVQSTDPGLLISEYAANPTGTDTANEYVELIATKSIDFSVTPYSVVFANNGTATTNGWIAGGQLTYGFNITSGTVARGDIVYVGGSNMEPTGTKLRVINTGTTGGDGFGNLNTGGVLGNGGANADAVAVFSVGIASITNSTVPVDAIFFGSGMGSAVVSSGSAGYQLPVNDRYIGGKLQTNSFLAPNVATDGSYTLATGTFNTVTGTWETARTWANGTATNNASAVTLTGVVGPQPIVPSCGATTWTVSPGMTATRPILATDADSDAITATLMLSPMANITLGSVMTSTGQYTGTLTVNSDVPAGDYVATINFTNEDNETASCQITISVAMQPIVPNCGTSPWAIEQGMGGNRTITATDMDSEAISATLMVMPPTANITLGNVITTTGRYTGTLMVNASIPNGTYTATINFTNEDSQTANCEIVINVATPPAGTRIRDIQGAAHISPMNGQSVSNVRGVVTAKKSNGFFMQDEMPDSDPATSEAIFVFTNSAPTVAVGDRVNVNGSVSEFRPGGLGDGGLTITQIGSPSITVLSSGNPLPAAIVIGNGGRVPPTTIINNDGTGNIETSGSFDVNEDGVDFYESLESMYVQVNNPVVVGPTNNFGEFVVLGDNGINAGLRTPRGGIITRPTDFNPERIMFDDAVMGANSSPDVDVNDSFSGSLVGVLDYGFGNFKIAFTQAPPAVVDGGLQPETTDTVSHNNEIAIASLNVENLDPSDTTFSQFGVYVVSNLKSPDILAVQEIQDNSGEQNNGVTDASQTYANLISAIQAAGGPTYQFTDIAPQNNQDGGAPGGNIRVGYLYRTDRGVNFVSRPGGNATTNTTIQTDANGPFLSFSPGRIQPGNTAWSSSRKPLAAEFTFNGERIFVINNHFNSKGGDNPLYGFNQPPVRESEQQRHQQAALVNAFVDSILAVDANASVVVLGDLNDFQFSETLEIVTGENENAPILVDLIETLPITEQYTYVFEGNSQVLDHILVSNALHANNNIEYDVVHVNSEFANQLSDHEPEVVRMTFQSAPTANLSTSVKQVNTTSVVAGSNLIYTVVVTNTGNASTTYMLTDVLDVNLSVINATGWTVNGQTLTANGTIAPGATVVKVFTVKVSNSFAGTINNSALLSGDGTTRTLTAPAVTVTAAPTAANYVNSSKTVNTTTINSGGLLTYTITISNVGDLAGTFALTDVLESSLTVVNAGDFTVNGQTLTLSGNIPAHSTITKSFTVRVSNSFVGMVHNTAALSGDGTTRNLTAPMVTVSANPTAANFAASAKTVSSIDVKVGDLLTYTITINNAGDLAGNYSVTDVLPSNLTVVNPGDFTVNGQTLTLDGSIAGHSNVTKSFTVRVGSVAGPVVNTATLSGDGTTRTLTAPTVNVTRYTLFTPVVLK